MKTTSSSSTRRATSPSGGGFEWNVPGEPLFGGAPVPPTAPDDVSFITHLVHRLEKQYCIDEKRVYATGFSGGARMASQLGCDASGVFAAIAPVSGLRLPVPVPLDPAGAGGVVPRHRRSRRPLHRATGRSTGPTACRWPRARWGAHNGCPAAAQVSTPDAGVELTTYSPCSGGSAVQLYSIVGEGHEWPGGPKLPAALTRVLGPQTTAISANSVMWTFFEAHPLP